MSEQPPKPPASRPGRGPGVSVLMILTGGALLFPGVCMLYVFRGDLGFGSGGRDVLYQALHIWLAICFLFGVVGVALIVRAVRR